MANRAFLIGLREEEIRIWYGKFLAGCLACSKNSQRSRSHYDNVLSVCMTVSG